MQAQSLRARLQELEEGLEAIQSILDELLPEEDERDDENS